ncbi:hypothetical protein RhiirA1_474761 [Rhizophagus irregularis]|uniref:Zinc-ribbon domain-containing protein n=1 Tax=Rhizophagus irregularis TaxID=588596 RepID=A0A2N0QY28_9GLOM|nr:hypothetical protein RhiirA1_474761 [Rhizophagus irregularis]
MYGIISKDLKAPYYEKIRFSYILPEKIPSVRSFSPERSTAIIFEDVCVAFESIQNRIIPFFTHRRYRNISNIYVTQCYYHTPIIICKNILHLVVFNGGSSHQDISKVIGRYTEDMKNTSMVVNKSSICNEKVDNKQCLWLCAIAGKRGGLYLSTEYVNANIPMRWRCADGHKWTTSLNNIKNGKTWCPYCANKASHTIEDAKQVAFSMSGMHLLTIKGACLSEYYINNRSALLWMCDKKHRWFATFDNVKHLNSIMALQSKYRAYNTKNISFHNGDPNNFIKQQARDQLKKELCKENQIALRYYVWYYEDPHIVISEHLRKLGLI